jgi:tRNA-Thr(GGU) m(6)t(6)A37 methyltransferase TsaA
MMDEIHLSPIGIVHTSRLLPDDDDWGDLVSEIRIDSSLPEESLAGLADFSHAEIVFQFHLADKNEVVPGARHPRENPDWPRVGVFAQRGKLRPNHLGLTIVRIRRVDERSLFVEGLDAVDGTPVLDIKPVMQEYLPRTPVRQPAWSHELMKNYWNKQE